MQDDPEENARQLAQTISDLREKDFREAVRTERAAAADLERQKTDQKNQKAVHDFGYILGTVLSKLNKEIKVIDRKIVYSKDRRPFEGLLASFKGRLVHRLSDTAHCLRFELESDLSVRVLVPGDTADEIIKFRASGCHEKINSAAIRLLRYSVAND